MQPPARLMRPGSDHSDRNSRPLRETHFELVVGRTHQLAIVAATAAVPPDYWCVTVMVHEPLTAKVAGQLLVCVTFFPTIPLIVTLVKVKGDEPVLVRVRIEVNVDGITVVESLADAFAEPPPDTVT